MEFRCRVTSWKDWQKANSVLARSNLAAMTQLAQMTVMINSMQVQLDNFSSAPIKPTSTKSKYYFWSWGSNYTHWSKTCSDKKAVHKEEAFYKKRLCGREKECEWRLGGVINKIEISNPKISLINCIRTPPNFPSNNTLAIAHSGANIHLEKQSTTTMAPVIISN